MYMITRKCKFNRCQSNRIKCLHLNYFKKQEFNKPFNKNNDTLDSYNLKRRKENTKLTFINSLSLYHYNTVTTVNM